jgi:lipid II:glycine glycyltransferase (peptidoglycan interpeptide bridge formation enzyme)
MSLWQSPLWAKFQKSLGYKTFRVQGILVVEKSLPFGKYFFEVQRANPKKKFWEKLKKRAHERGAIFCRFAPNVREIFIPSSPIFCSQLQRFPERTRIVDISISETEIFSQYSQVCRRHIRIAEKNDVVVEQSNDVKTFEELSKTTALRNHFSVHKAKYFQLLLDTFKDDARLFMARKGTEYLCGGIFIFSNESAYYYYGASSNTFRNINAPTLLQWEAMKWAKEKGGKYFDLLGIAPSDDGNHRLSAVTQFKKKFGGEVVSFYPESNIVFSRFWYFLYRFSKNVRSKLQKISEKKARK